MALYAIGDPHLSFYKPKPMDIFGERWENHAEKLKKGFEIVQPEDTVVICGDISWGMGLKETLPDFQFLDALPGKKIIVKGNHDYWWTTASKTKAFFAENGIESIEVLFNNSFLYNDIALCGTRGWFFEEETGSAHDKKIMLREVGRLRCSLESAGEREKLVFLHYPPLYLKYRCPEILLLLREYEVRLCCYGHIHGRGRNAAFQGRFEGTEYRLVSADHVNFTPVKLLDE